jgi:hypothetical protein
MPIAPSTSDSQQAGEYSSCSWKKPDERDDVGWGSSLAGSTQSESECELPRVDAGAVPRSERAQSLTGWTPVACPLDGAMMHAELSRRSRNPNLRLRNDEHPGRLGSRKASGD